MRKQTRSRNRGWLAAIRRRLESYGGHVGNRLSVAAGVALVAGMMAGTAQGAWPDYLASGGDRTMWTNFTGTATQIVYGIHSYTNAGVATNFVPSADLPKVEFLVIGGGGGGGGGGANYEGGGGGAGGYICSVQGERSGSNTDWVATTSLTANVTVPVSVGGGGAAGSSSGNGGNGTNSYFGSIEATGGGGGAAAGTAPSGGSGGGAHGLSNTGYGAGTSGQGYRGGVGDGGGYGAGGGGGAGQAGGAGANVSAKGVGGYGGTGLWSRITGEWIQRAGGGGGAGYDVISSGGAGGGGGGGKTGSVGTPGTNTYGGGGGGGTGAGAEGGSGIVIVRYEIPAIVPTITVSPPSLAFGTVFLSPTATKTMSNTVSGVNLTDNITVTAPCPEFEISTNNVDFTNTYTLIHVGGTVPTTTNYVRFTSSVISNYDAYITNTSSGAATQTIHVTALAKNQSPTLDAPNPASLSLGNVITNKASTNSYTLTGAFLADNVTVTAPSPYLVSTNTSVAFASSVTLMTNSDASLNATVYVQFTPTNGQAYSGIITNTSGALTQTVSLTGTGVVQTLYVSAGTLACGNLAVGVSSTNSFTVSGTNLDDNVTVTSPSAEFTVSTNATGSFGSSCTVLVAGASAPSGATLSTLVYVKFTPSAAGSYSTNITCSSAGAVSQNKAVSGNGVVPTLYVSGGTLAFGDVITNKTTFSQSYTVTGSNLLANVSVNAPSGFKVSTSSGSGFGSSLTLTTNASGHVPLTTVYVRFNPTAVQYYSSSITNSSTGAANGLQAVTGNGVVRIAGLVSSVGDIVFLTNLNSKAYGVHVFTTTNVTYNFAPSKEVTNVEFLVIGGGGGGGSGGGGAGGYICSVQGEQSGSNTAAVATTSLTANVSVPVSVGGGGPAGSSGVNGGNGINSSFGSIVALGGGGGGATTGSAGTGGSGGGANASNPQYTGYGAGTARQGWQGGGPSEYNAASGGGGGAGQAGGAGYRGTGNAGCGGAGGTGLLSRITGEWIQRAGGGGAYGDISVNGIVGPAGAGGGGTGGGGPSNVAPKQGTDTYGGGGGGANGGAGAKGGSGIVIIRYEITPPQGTVIMMR
jgi:hypothetical protein